MLLSPANSLPLQRMNVGPKDIFGCQNVSSGDRAVQEELAVNDLEKVVCGGISNHSLKLVSE